MYTKYYSAVFRAKVVHELLNTEKRVTEIAFEFGVSPNRLLKWQKYLIKKVLLFHSCIGNSI